MSELSTQAERRRTFAIISHPDAGKTTLTEKLLLYGGAIHLAGSVTSRKAQPAPALTGWRWRKSRGISSLLLRAAVRVPGPLLLTCWTPRATPIFLRIPTERCRLWTAAVMVIDAAKGVEGRP